MKRLFFHALPLMLLSISVGACSWAGQKTGKAINAVEKGAAEFEQGYKQERASKEPQQSPEQQTPGRQPPEQQPPEQQISE